MSNIQSIVGRQLAAYNARDIETFMSCWHDDAEYFEHPNTLLARGADSIRARHVTRFQEPDLYGRLTSRIVAGELVVDHEVVTRNFAEGRGTVDVIAMYEIRDGRIAKAWFKQGPRRMDGASVWDERVERVWQRFRSGTLAEGALIPEIDALAADRDAEAGPAAFERASARDSLGLEAEAEPLYRRALSLGLEPARRAQATIQLASTLRLLGRLDESEALLRVAIDRDSSSADRSALVNEARAFLALTLLAQGKSREAAAHALTALAPHLSRYNRSAANYAAEVFASLGGISG